jgi:chlorophyllide a oxygenase
MEQHFDLKNSALLQFSYSASCLADLILFDMYQVQELLSEEAQERTSVADLQHQLVDLQAEVSAAHKQLHLTQARVHQNVQRVAELKSEAVQLELMRQLPEADEPASAVAGTATQRSQDVERALAHQSASTSAAAATQTQSAPQASSSTTAVRPAAPQQRKGVTARQRGLQSSLEIEEGLKNFWYPAAFASQLHKDTPVSFDLFGQPWVLFRNKAGEPACVRDECAHRACPLSLGKVIDGNIQCAYHGWQYNQQGQCVSMPSTAACPNIAVSSMACKEEAGFVLVWPGQGPQPAVPNLAPPEGFQIHAEIEVWSPGYCAYGSKRACDLQQLRLQSGPDLHFVACAHQGTHAQSRHHMLIHAF